MNNGGREEEDEGGPKEQGRGWGLEGVSKKGEGKAKVCAQTYTCRSEARIKTSMKEHPRKRGHWNGMGLNVIMILRQAPCSLPGSNDRMQHRHTPKR